MARASAKKRWFNISSPKLFKEAILGETPSIDPKQLAGRTVNVNLSTLTNDMRSTNTEVTLLFDHIEGDKIKTALIGLRILPTSIKRVVRKGRGRHDISTKLITKDEKVVTLKVLLITRRVVKGSVSRALESDARKFLAKKVALLDFENLYESVIFNKLQKELSQRLSKIYPVRICEIRVLKYERFIKAADLKKVKINVAKQAKKTDSEEPEEETKESEQGKSEKKSDEKSDKNMKKTKKADAVEEQQAESEDQEEEDEQEEPTDNPVQEEQAEQSEVQQEEPGQDKSKRPESSVTDSEKPAEES